MNFEKMRKSEFWKNENKNCWGYDFTLVYQKPQLYDVSSWDIVWDKIFCPFTP